MGVGGGKGAATGIGGTAAATRRGEIHLAAPRGSCRRRPGLQGRRRAGWVRWAAARWELPAMPGVAGAAAPEMGEVGGGAGWSGGGGA